MRRAFVVAAAVVALVASACTRDTANSASTVHVADPGKCVPIDIAAATEIAPVLTKLAKAFNASSAARPTGQRCWFARVLPMDSAAAADHLVDGWPEPAKFGPPPALWAPASSEWIELANEKAGTLGHGPISSGGPSIAVAKPVLAFPEPMARALGWPDRQLQWPDVASFAATPNFWATVGHPEWGAFRLGKANPNYDTAALLQTLATRSLDVQQQRALEAAVVYYGDANWPYLDNLLRRDHARLPLTFVSAVVTDERSVIAWNENNGSGNVPARPPLAKDKPHVPLVGVTIDDPNNTATSDYPLATVSGSWVSSDASNGAIAFSRYVVVNAGSSTLHAAGFEPGAAHSPFGDVTLALDGWNRIRKHSRVLLLVDVSDSMGDAADPKNLKGPSKLDRLKPALKSAVDRLEPDDEVGLRIFTTKLHGGPSDKWLDLVPVGSGPANRDAITRAIDGLRRMNGAPLFAATRDAYDSMAAQSDPARINGVVLITDGYNEDDQFKSRKTLLAGLGDTVRFVTVGYSNDASVASLKLIAQATDGRFVNAANTATIDDAVISALSSFSSRPPALGTRPAR